MRRLVDSLETLGDELYGADHLCAEPEAAEMLVDAIEQTRAFYLGVARRGSGVALWLS